MDMRAHFNKFTRGGGVGVLIGVAIWIMQGGFSIPKPTPPLYWVGVVFMVIGVGLGIYGWFGKPYKEIKLIDDIRADLVNMSVIERNTATAMSPQLELPKETVIQIFKDCEKVLGDCLSKFDSICINKEWDALTRYCDAVGRILDMNNIGLKFALINNELYKTCELDLEQKRLQLKPSKRHKFTHPNIVRVKQLSYGFNSHIIIRGVFAKYTEYIKEIPIEIRLFLEGIENASAALLKVMLDDLEGDWNKEKKVWK